MANEYYDHTTFPQAGTRASSAQMRTELDDIEAGFDKLPTLAGNGGEIVVVNAGGTALETKTTVQLNLVLDTGDTYTGVHDFSGATTVTLPADTSIGLVSATEISYVNGVTSAIQTQIDTKAALAGATYTGAHDFSGASGVTLPAATSIGNASATEIGYLDGVTSAIQTQLNAKVNIAGGSTLSGSHDYTSATLLAATQAPGDSSTNVATTAFVSATAFTSALPGQTDNAGKYLQTDGASASWQFLVDGDVPSALTGKTYNGLTVSTGVNTLTLTSGTAALTVNSSGTLGSAAYTASTAYQAANANLTTWAAKTVPSGTVVGTSDSQTLTSKTLSTSCTWQGNVIGATYGGTGNAYTAFSGPTTSTKTFTLPNASATILTTNTAVTAAQGGTGLTSYAVGDLVYASGATTLASLADVAAGNVLLSGGVNTAPSYGKVALTTHVSGVLPVANGGTNNQYFTVSGPASSAKTYTFANENMEVGFRSVPQNIRSAAYTLVLDDAGRHIFHPSADTTARTYTIPANSSVAYPTGTAITFINQNGAGVITIAITTDTMRLAGAGTTGSRSLAANGVATAVKVTSTEWIISGTGLS